MPFSLPVPEFLTSRRHLAAAGVGLAVIAALTTATTFAPAPGAPAAAAATPAPVATASDLPTTAVVDDLPSLAATPSGPRPSASASTTPTPNGPAITALADQGIPIVALDAYRASAQRQARDRPSCHLAWTLVAAIGAVESGHGTHAGARLYADGQDLPRVIGPVLDGTAGNARIADTDKGVLDGDEVYDRAVGPMQFIPSTWAAHGLDGNGDGRADPFNIFDAAATTGAYLCQGGGDLATDAGRAAAVFSYNHLDSYVATVLALDAAYAHRPVPTTSPSPAAPPTTPAPRTPTRPAPEPTAGRPAKPAPTTPTTPRPTPTPTCPTGTPTSGPTTRPTASPTPTPTGCPTTPAPGSSAPSSGSRSASPPPSASPSVAGTASSTGVTPSPTPTPSG